MESRGGPTGKSPFHFPLRGKRRGKVVVGPQRGPTFSSYRVNTLIFPPTVTFSPFFPPYEGKGKGGPLAPKGAHFSPLRGERESTGFHLSLSGGKHFPPWGEKGFSSKLYPPVGGKSGAGRKSGPPTGAHDYGGKS